jgi:hypothetical protein
MLPDSEALFPGKAFAQAKICEFFHKHITCIPAQTVVQAARIHFDHAQVGFPDAQVSLDNAQVGCAPARVGFMAVRARFEIGVA